MQTGFPRGSQATWFLVAFSWFAVFNLLDLSSTLLALKMGLSEGNAILLLLASKLDLSLLETVVIVKAVFFIGSALLLILGIHSQNARTRRAILMTFVAFAVLFAIVSTSNFLSIYSAA